MRQQSFHGLALYGYVLGVHVVSANLFAFHRSERAGSHVQGYFLADDALCVQFLQYLLCKVQSGSGGSHAAFNFAVHRLVGFLVALFRLPVQIGRNGQFAHRFQNLCP